MYLADTLSRAHLPAVNTCAFTHLLEETDHRALLAIPPDQLERVKQASADDLVLTELRATIQAGWPEHKSQVSESVVAYYDVRDELTVQDSLVFKGPLIVIPNTLRKEMIELVHSTHIGTAQKGAYDVPVTSCTGLACHTTERLCLKVWRLHGSPTSPKQGANSTTWVCGKAMVEGGCWPLWAEGPHTACGEWLL